MRLATTSGAWPFDPAQWQAWLSEPECLPFFLQRGDQDIGHFALRARDGQRHLSWVIIRASQRGGLGRALLDQAVDAARSAGATRLTLNVLHSNTRALHLYSAYGFTPLSEEGGKVHMALPLGPDHGLS